jgi:hypothetical protein
MATTIPPEGFAAPDTVRCGHSYRLSTGACPSTCVDGGPRVGEPCGVGNWGLCRDSSACVRCTTGNSCAHPCASNGITTCDQFNVIPRCTNTGGAMNARNNGSPCTHDNGSMGTCNNGQCCVGADCTVTVRINVS